MIGRFDARSRWENNAWGNGPTNEADTCVAYDGTPRLECNSRARIGTGSKWIDAE